MGDARFEAVRVTAIREVTLPVSRYADPSVPSGGLTTSVVAVETDAWKDGHRLVGYGFASVGRYGQGGLIRERFAPRLLASAPGVLTGDDGFPDPRKAWSAMMAGEKPGGHGERCVAVGTLDMAFWDLAAKARSLPLWALLASSPGPATAPRVPVYAAGGYRYPDGDLGRLRDEMCRYRDLGHVRVKMKIGAASLPEDLRRVEAALEGFPAGKLAVDAMNAYGPLQAVQAAGALSRAPLWWFEDICDPLDFGTLASVAATAPWRVAAGEALFSEAEALLLAAHGGLRPGRDVLLFDPVHCYGLPGYLAIVRAMEARGWERSSFWPHGGNLFSLHVAAGLGLGGAECNPFSFMPFSALPPGMSPSGGEMAPGDEPGIGFEAVGPMAGLLRELGDG